MEKETLQSVINGLTAKFLRQEEENSRLKNTLETIESQIGTLVVGNRGYAEDLTQLKKNYEDLSKALRQISSKNNQ